MNERSGPAIPGYTITARLGRGGQSTVYRAEDNQLRRTVAIKMLAEQWLADRTSRKRFLLEARTLSALNHPHIAAVYRVDEHLGHPFIVMEYVDGLTLSRHAAERELSLADKLALMIQIAEAVRYAHSAGVLHRDLKPENILVSSAGYVKLVDFGLAKLRPGADSLEHGPAERLTATGTVMGTAAYLSPEQAQGLEIDERSDLFALGILFYELLAGRSPFPRDNPVQALMAILNEEPRPFDPGSPIPGPLKSLIFTLLEKEPDRRLPTAAALLKRLCAIAGTAAPPPVICPVKPPSRWAGWGRRHKRSFLVTAAMVVLAVAGGMVWQSRLAARSETASMLVLPVRSADDDKSRWLADMLTGELVSALGGSLRLKVLYVPGGSPRHNRELAERVMRERAVRYVVDGEMIRTGEALRVTARVLDGAESSVLWTGSVTGPMDDFYAITGKMASNVASAVGVYVAAEQIRFPGRTVFEHYTRGLILVRRRESEHLDEAVRQLSRCIELDPGFAPAYAALAEAYLNYQNLGVSDDPRYLRESEQCVLEGLKRKGDDAELHMILARLSECRYDWDRCAREVDRVIELKPSGFDSPYIVQAAVRTRQGRIDAALESYRKAHEINPFNPVPWVNQAVLAAMTDNPAAADEAYGNLKNLYAPREFLLIAQAWWLASRGEVRDAARLLDSESRREPHPLLVVSSAEMAFAAGNYHQAAGRMNEWLAANRYSLESYWLLGLCYESMGDQSMARATARQALQRARELAGAEPGEPLGSYIQYFAAAAGEAAPPDGKSGGARVDPDTVSRYLRATAGARRGNRSAMAGAGTPFDYSYWMNRFSAVERKLLEQIP
jgi:TolB-like protein/tRNA A-37 threonylcarbamoyl transferase component Bud32/tetratricopeptide (TPR) repeat protein